MSNDTLQTKNWFYTAPFNYLEDERLNIYDKMTYNVICAFASAATKTAFPSATTIAKKGGFGRTKVFECLKKLEQLGYIKRKQRFMVTSDKKTGKRKISNDTNEYTLIAPSTHDELPPSSRHELVHEANHLPSSQDELVHDTNYPPSSPHEHRTDLDFDYDLDNDDDKKIVHEISVQIYQELVSVYTEINLLQVCEKMKDCLEHNPGDLYKYVRKAVIKDLEDIKKGKPRKVNAANLKRKTKSNKSGRTEVIPDWFDSEEQPTQPKTSNADLEAKKRAIEEKLKAFRK
jgi:Helix-turn-helix domain